MNFGIFGRVTKLVRSLPRTDLFTRPETANLIIWVSKSMEGSLGDLQNSVIESANRIAARLLTPMI